MPGDDGRTRTARVGRVEERAVRLDGSAQDERLVVEVDVLNGVAEAEVGQEDVEEPRERLGLVGETDPRALEDVDEHHRARH